MVVLSGIFDFKERKHSESFATPVGVRMEIKEQIYNFVNTRYNSNPLHEDVEFVCAEMGIEHSTFLKFYDDRVKFLEQKG